MTAQGGLNGNVLHNLGHGNTRSLTGGTVWTGLGGLALLEEVCHRGWVSRFQRLTPFPVCSPYFLLYSRGELSDAVPAAMPLKPSELEAQINPFVNYGLSQQ